MPLRLDELRVIDPVLTTVAQSYKNSAFIADKILPVIPVRKTKGKLPIFSRDAFVTRDTKRAIRAASNRIPASDFELIEFETIERDVEMAIDYIESEEAAEFTKYEQRISKDLSDILLLGKEQEIAEYLQDPANYPNDAKLVIDDTNAFNDYTNFVDPMQIIRQSIQAVREKIARYPNTMILGDSVYDALMNHPKLLARVRYFGLEKVNLKIISEILEIPSVFVGMSVFSNSLGEFEDIWKDNIILAYVDRNEVSGRSIYNPSFGYILQKEGQPEIDTYFENGGKIKVIRNTDNYCWKITGADSAFLIHNTNHTIQENGND